MTDQHPPDVDLVIAFRATKSTSLSKHQTREDARKAEQQYKRLIETLTYAGLKAVGRRGESLGHLLVFVTCPPKHVEELIKRERHSDFLSGLPVSPASGVLPLSPADRLRLVHAYISSTPPDGGLGISSDAPEWDLVEAIFPLHDREFNETWNRAWKLQNIASVQLERIRDQFGDSLALYFAFLASYTKFLLFPAVLGLVGHFLLPPYAPVYSILLSIWSIVFVEWWRVRERILSLRFGTRGSFKVEKRRAQYKKGLPWWARELRILASVPVILLFSAILGAILTGIFVFEAFVTQLYEGPGKHFITFSPTILFVVLVPRVLAIYQAIAVRLTNWENHAHKSTYAGSLTLKTFALSAIVAYMGLGLSAFVYVPFGEGVMRWVQAWLFGGVKTDRGFTATLRDMLNGTVTSVGKDSTIVVDSLTGATAPTSHGSVWDASPSNVSTKLNPGRLRDQMFAYTVTNQIINTTLEVGLPFVLRKVDAFRKSRAAAHNKPKGIVSSPPAPSVTGSSGASNSGASESGSGNNGGGLKKRVVFEDEKERGGMVERAFLDRVRAEAALPEYDLFVDYNEMVVQFGYVVLWSTIWPLAGVMAFLNNLLELRSDAFKMTVHNRRPIPSRTDTIGPWLEALTFLTWLGAMTNSALVYLFSPQLLSAPISPSIFNTTESNISSVVKETTAAVEDHLVSVAGGLSSSTVIPSPSSAPALAATKELLLKAILVALVASHGFLLMRLLIRHIVERVFWRGSGEVEEREREDREVKMQFLKGGAGGRGITLVGEVRIEREVDDADGGVVDGETGPRDDGMGFWDHDEGVDEIQRISKEA
ncbi:hypothetical protein GALMADRAFT_103009 [Galerina marginata CBS 339.88]|uniref:DUF590-domain-containing protein n=1 Tax=Galerina marginata (strain CBS 339.88) TaxID=685588 RepID=A0A067SW61_GALM3|nr:hypothetical protein GALMADRAFT_103009 [Galerina marginata CBS 339.88]